MYDVETVSPESAAYSEEASYSEPQVVPARRGQFLWLCALILSFCYELPLARLTTMERLNPRIFDVVFFIGMVTILPGLDRREKLPKLFRIWAWIVAVFCVCALVWVPFFPWYYGKYTIFFALKYIEGLLAIYMVTRISITSQQKKILHYLTIVGGLVVTLCAIPQYLQGGASSVFVTRTGEELVYTPGTLTSCLAGSYFHVSMFSIVSSVMGLSLFQTVRLPWSKVLSLGLGIFLGLPAFFSGARLGIVGCLVAWMSFFILAKVSFKAAITTFVIIVLMVLSIYSPKMLSLDYLAEKSPGVRKMMGIKEEERLHAKWFNLELYRWHAGLIPFIGAGFGAAPVMDPDGTVRYRPGYGIHNAYLMAIEQGGIAVFVLFIAFLYNCGKGLSKMRHSDIAVDVAFATGAQALLIAQLVTNLAGLFWLCTGMGHFLFYNIILFVLATKKSIPDEHYYFEAGLTQ